MILKDKEILKMIDVLNQEHKNRRKSIIAFGLNCSDYVTMQEAFSLPYQYREEIYEMVKERLKELEKKTS